MKTLKYLAAGLALVSASMSAQASTPSYNFMELSYVNLDVHNNSTDMAGGQFTLSGQVHEYVILRASFEYLESDSVGGVERDQKTGIVGVAGRFPLVPSMLDLTGGVDYVYSDLGNSYGPNLPQDHDGGYQVHVGARANFGHFEVSPGIRWINVLDDTNAHLAYNDEEFYYGVQGLACIGNGLCATAGIEHAHDTDDMRYTAGLRFVLDLGGDR